MQPKKIILLGATGSIGKTTLDIIEAYPDRFQLVGFSYHKNTEKAVEIWRRFPSASVCSTGLGDGGLSPEVWKDLKVKLLPVDDLLELKYDVLVSAMVGSAGVRSTLKAVSQGREIHLANKESLVMAGPHILEAAAKSGANILPVDSEHNSIYRLLRGGRQVRKIVLTASGGALRNFPLARLGQAKPGDVLNHPTWSMGDKITVDSATMANKALEVIEAHHLFGLPYEEIEAVIHPQSFIHAIAEEFDGSFTCHVYPPDMSYSIAYCLFYPERAPQTGKQTEIPDFPDFHFHKLDPERYQCYYLGREAGRRGGGFPAVFNAANEMSVELFLNGQIEFGKIAKIVESSLEGHDKKEAQTSMPSLDDLFAIDRGTRERIREVFA